MALHGHNAVTSPAGTTQSSPSRKAPRKLTLLPLIAATYFMVAGGPYGLEDLIGKTGYALALVILVLTPLLWSLPTALMVSELASALPEEGGFYIWVRRGMGNFWGYQESWLSLTGSIFEMALYPTLFVDYLGRIAPQLTAGRRGLLLEFALIAICTAWNILGARAVGDGSFGLNILLFVPFVFLIGFAVVHPSTATTAPRVDHADLLGGLLVAMWNYMGWDNLSTIAGEVDRPQYTYPWAMFCSVILVTLGYLLPVAAVAHLRLSLDIWTAGGWVDAARLASGPWLAVAVSAAGAIGALGSFAALMLSFTRLPAVMAADGFLPRIFARYHLRTGAPWVSILVCAGAWAVCLQLGFVEILILDVMLTGLSILLEFWALVGLRIREPNLPRPYRVPGGMFGAIAIGIPPLILIALSLLRNHSEAVNTPFGATNGLIVGLAIIALGVAVYFLSPGSRRARRSSSS